MFQDIVVLTGAGVSRESGLATFRDPDGIWAKVNLEDVATPGAFARNPELVHSFYNARRRQLLSETLQPNAAHLALAELQRAWQGRVTLITQNIDNLHERARSPDVLHMHGELLKARCTRCKNAMPWEQDLNISTACPHCGLPGGLRPDVVWFGEMPMHMDAIQHALDESHLFISIGTSGAVYPAAGFAAAAKASGAHTVELNLEASEVASTFDEAVYGPATEVVVNYVDRLLSRSQSR